MGYYFAIDYFKYPEIINRDKIIEFEISIANSVAHLFIMDYQ